MKFLPLLWANLGRKRLRTTLTLASIVIAFLLFGMLQTLNAALTGGSALAGVDRLVTRHRVSMIQPLPESYWNRIRSVEGVREVSPQDWFGGIQPDGRTQITAFAVDAPTFLKIYPEYKMPADQRNTWLQERTGAIVGKALAEESKWKVGATIPLQSNLFTQKDGTNVWPMKIIGVYEATNGDQSLYFHRAYLEETRSFGKGTAGMFGVQVKDAKQSEQVARSIDALFTNSPAETKTSTEEAFIQGFANQMGNIGAIVTAVATAVFFTMLLVTANTMAQSVRERTNELAVMKTLGFSSLRVTSLVMSEALLVTLLGAMVGLGLSGLASMLLGQKIQQFFPSLGMPPDTYAVGALLAAGLGALSGAVPCMQAWQLKIVDALRKN